MHSAPSAAGDRTELSFLIQAPQNVGPNLTHVAAWLCDSPGGRPITGPVRLQSRVNEVTLRGRKVALSTPTVRMTVRKPEFVLEIDLPYRDSGGRIVPALCYGLMPPPDDEAFPGRVADEMAAFLAAVDMRTDDDVGALVEQTAAALLKLSTADSRRSALGQFLAPVERLLGRPDRAPAPGPDRPRPRHEAGAQDPTAAQQAREVQLQLTPAEAQTVLLALAIARDASRATAEMTVVGERIETALRQVGGATGPEGCDGLT